MTKFLGLLHADAASEAGLPPDPELFARMGPFIEEVMKAGVLVATDGLQPSSKGKRVKLEGGKMSVIDGPFTESKELVASFAIYDVPTIEEAISWTERFLEVLGGGTCEIRPFMTFDDFPADLATPEAIAQEDRWREQMAKNAEEKR
jgi:hypothetical protein